MKKRIIICGAGIGGLTVAHELAKRDFDVVVYERNSITGGLARSAYTHIDGHTYPTEYSWRVYGYGYKNLLRILREIPLRENSGQSVFDNLITIGAYLFPRFDRKGFAIGNKTSSSIFDWRFTKRDYWRIADKILTCSTMSAKRMNDMDHVRWRDYCEDLSPEARKYLVTFWGPALGMDPTHMSFPVVARFVSLLFGGLIGKVSTLFLLNKPTNDSWFDEWEAFLKSTKNVRIYTGHEVQDFEVTDGIITGVKVLNKETGEAFVDTASEIVCGLSLEVIAKLIRQHPILSDRSDLLKLTKLARTSEQVQLSIQIFLDQKINYSNDEKLVLYLPDSPWAIIIEPEALIWDQTFCSNPRVKSVWSVGICQTDVPGIRHTKPFVECNSKEIEEEVMAQIERSYKHHGITMEDGSPVDESHIVKFYMWDSFQYDETFKRVVTWEPKFSNNAGGYQDQPKTLTSIKNLSFATAYTRTDRFIYSMESAAEAGIRCANQLIKKHESAYRLVPIVSFDHTPWFLKPLVWLDLLLFKLRIPHAGKLLGNATILFLLYALLCALILSSILYFLIDLL